MRTMLFKDARPRIQHINARPQAPVVVFEFHVVYHSGSLRRRGDPAAIRRPCAATVQDRVVARTHYSISRRAARSVVGSKCDDY